MSGRLNQRLHHPLGLIYTTIESAFLTAGTVLATLALLVVVYITLYFMGR